MNKDYYSILGVNKGASQDEIKQAFRTLSKKYHPDKNPGNKDAEEKFKEINEAYSTIGDEQKRRVYDMSMSGGGFDPFMFFHMERQMASNIQMVMDVTVEEAYYGCKKPTRIGMRVFNVDIPKGVTTGQTLKFAGLGMKGYDTSGHETTGDLYVKIRVVNTGDKMWLDNDGTLEIMFAINWLDAILGSEQEVDIFDKTVKFKTPKFIQNGGYSIVGGKGFPKFKKDDEYGNLKINYIIRMPKNLSPEHLDMIGKIKKETEKEM